jgi:hypothetical protein
MDTPAERRATPSLFWSLTLLAVLAIVTYLPTLTQPFISDDFTNILFSRRYAFSSWGAVMADPVSRVRTTSWVLTYWIDRLFGLRPAAFYGVSILLHVLNTWLVFALGSWRVIGWRVAPLAAGFFAVLEGHQEAVMWYSAVNELLLFLFGVLCVLAWIKFIQDPKMRWEWLGISFVCLLCAFATKESAVIIVPLLGLVWLSEGQARWRILGLTPFAIGGVIYAWSIYRTRSYSFRFHDGSFSLHAPVWITLPHTFGRLLWPWGVISLIAIVIWHAREWRRLIAFSVAWAAISLLPYSFLTYMTQAPSRQTYLASAGAAWIVAAGLITVWDRSAISQRRWVYALATLIVIHNCVYLWTKKRRQFLARAASTQALIHQARNTSGAIYIPCAPSTDWRGCQCFPYAPLVAAAALELETTKPSSELIWGDTQPGAVEFCWRER